MECLPSRTLHRVLLTLLLMVLCAGCESLDRAMFMGEDGPGFQQQEEEHRSRYLTEGDPDALRWLLANRLRSGMSLEDVNRVIGAQGAREWSDGWLKNDGGRFHATDIAYKWGPDRTGKSLFLVFRDGELVHFNPKEFADEI